MEKHEVIFEGAPTVVGEIRANLLEPFIEATTTALGEMAGAEVNVRTIHQQAIPQRLEDITAVVEMMSATGGFLILSFPQRTAAALAARMLAGVTQEVDDSLIRDCVGEIANVIAGQAKAILAGGPYRFTFSIPKVLSSVSEFRPPPGMNCLAIIFGSDQGDFAVQVWR